MDPVTKDPNRHLPDEALDAMAHGMIHRLCRKGDRRFRTKRQRVYTLRREKACRYTPAREKQALERAIELVESGDA